jgi:pimeloyl-ACP methyl ester carboxylesterase
MTLAHHRIGSGPPLLLVHGIGSQWQVWEPVIGRLAREREVVAVDLPGFGASPPLAETPTVEALARAVAAFAAEFGLERPHVAGNSLGGGVALALGAMDAVSSVCGLSPLGFARGREPAYARATLLFSRQGAQLLKPVAETAYGGPVRRTLLFGHLTARPWRIPAAAAVEASRALADCPGFDATIAAADFSAVPAGCPTTIAWGEKDRLLIYSRQAPRARRELPAARHITLRGCGHVPTWDDPEQVARVLLDASAG